MCLGFLRFVSQSGVRRGSLTAESCGTFHVLLTLTSSSLLEEEDRITSQRYRCPSLGDTAVSALHVAAHLNYNFLATQNSVFGLSSYLNHSF